MGDTQAEADILLAQAEAYDPKSECKERISVALKAHALARSLGDKKLQAASSLVLANAGKDGHSSNRKERIKLACRFANEALLNFEALHDTNGKGQALHALSAILFVEEKSLDWLSTAEEALELFRSIGDHKLVAQELQSIAFFLLERGDHVKALKLADEAWEIFGELGERGHEESLAAHCMVHALVRSGQPGEALRVAQDSLEMFREVAEPRGEAAALGLLAVAHMAAGDDAQAEHAAAQALLLSQDLQDVGGEGSARRLLLELYARQGDADKWREHAERTEAEDLLEAAMVLKDFVRARLANGDGGAALEEAGRLRGVCRGAGHGEAEGIALLSMCSVHCDAAELSECLARAREAAEIFRREGLASWEGDALTVLAQAHMERGEYQSVPTPARRASRLFATLGDRRREATARFLLVNSWLTLPGPQRPVPEALREVAGALGSARALEDQGLQATALSMAAQLHNSAGAHEAALEAAKEALELLWQAGGDASSKASLLLICADTYIKLRRYGEAQVPAEDAFELAEQEGNKRIMQLALGMLETVDQSGAPEVIPQTWRH